MSFVMMLAYAGSEIDLHLNTHCQMTLLSTWGAWRRPFSFLHRAFIRLLLDLLLYMDVHSYWSLGEVNMNRRCTSSISDTTQHYTVWSLLYLIQRPASLWFFKKKSKTPVQNLKILMILNFCYKNLCIKIANAVQSAKRLLSSNSKFCIRIFPSKRNPIISHWWNALKLVTLSEKSRFAIHFHAQK